MRDERVAAPACQRACAAFRHAASELGVSALSVAHPSGVRARRFARTRGFGFRDDGGCHVCPGTPFRTDASASTKRVRRGAQIGVRAILPVLQVDGIQSDAMRYGEQEVDNREAIHMAADFGIRESDAHGPVAVHTRRGISRNSTDLPALTSNDPIYLQLAAIMRERIFSKRWTAGSKIPSEH